MRKSIVAFAAGVIVATLIIGGRAALANPGDPCASLVNTSGNSVSGYENYRYLDCRLDRQDAALKRIEAKLGTTPGSPSPSPSATPSRSPSSPVTPTATPTPTQSPTPSSSRTPSATPGQPPSFPNAANTGVPPGVTLTAFTGVKSITTPTTIDAKTITGTIVVKAPLIVTRSKLVGNFDVDYVGGTLTIADSEVDGGTSQAPAVGYGDITMRRVEVKGSRVSVLCGSNCDIQSSWLHGQYLKPGTDWHVNGYVSNGGSNVLVKGNTIACDAPDNSDGGGCTGPAASFGDFAPLRKITYDGNLFKSGPGGYCLAAGYNESKPHGKDPTSVRVTNNVFERGPNGKCGYWGAVTSFLNANGNVASGNTWDNGAPVSVGG